MTANGRPNLHLPLPKTRSYEHVKDLDRPAFDWLALLGAYVHPVKVAILEAMSWIDEPLSAAELTRILAGQSLGVVSYHLTSLAERGVIEPVSERQARGARETYYFYR